MFMVLYWQLNLLYFTKVFLLLLRTEVQPTSGPQQSDRVTVQCATPGTGGELVDVCVMCGKARSSRSEQLSAICSTPSLDLHHALLHMATTGLHGQVFQQGHSHKKT